MPPQDSHLNAPQRIASCARSAGAREDSPGESPESSEDRTTEHARPDYRVMAFDLAALIDLAIQRAASICNMPPERVSVQLHEACDVMHGPRDHIELALLELIALAVHIAEDRAIVVAVGPEREKEAGHAGVRFCVRIPEHQDAAQGTRTIRSSSEFALARSVLDAAGTDCQFSANGNAIEMSFIIVNQPPSATDGRSRAHARLPLDGVTCDRGEVIDLSLSGLRIETTRVPRKPIDLVLDDGDSSITVRAKSVWSKRTGWRRFEVGLIFVDLSEGDVRKLTNIALTNRARRIIGDDHMSQAA